MASARVAIMANATKAEKGGEFIVSFPPFQSERLEGSVEQDEDEKKIPRDPPSRSSI